MAGTSRIWQVPLTCCNVVDNGQTDNKSGCYKNVKKDSKTDS